MDRDCYINRLPDERALDPYLASGALLAYGLPPHMHLDAFYEWEASRHLRAPHELADFALARLELLRR